MSKKLYICEYSKKGFNTNRVWLEKRENDKKSTPQRTEKTN